MATFYGSAQVQNRIRRQTERPPDQNGHHRPVPQQPGRLNWPIECASFADRSDAWPEMVGLGWGEGHLVKWKT